MDGVAWTMPCVEVEDVPRFGWRGAMLDVARHFMPKAFVLRFIDLLALHKLNVFHWHLTDDQGWRIEIKKYPRLTEIGAWRKETLVGRLQRDAEMVFDGVPHGGFYTQDDVREVVAYAQARHITVVPEDESGRYVFYGIPTGTYSLIPVLPSGLSAQIGSVLVGEERGKVAGIAVVQKTGYHVYLPMTLKQ